MGNDIKLPSNQRRELLAEKQKASEAEAREQINREIDKISDKVLSINNQINRVEYNLKLINQNIQYYQDLIKEMSNALNHIEIEQINEGLTHEHFVQKSKWYLETMNVEELAEKDINTCDDYSEENIANLQASVDTLNNKIAENEEIISKYFEKY